MQLEVTEGTDGISHVALVGRLDIGGVQEVDLKFTARTAARNQPAVIDVSRLEFIASLGMGMLITCAQALRRKGHAMVLVGAAGNVDMALRTAGIDQAIPMVPDLDAALALLGQT